MRKSNVIETVVAAGQILVNASGMLSCINEMDQLVSKLNNRTLNIDLSDCQGEYPRGIEQTAAAMKDTAAALRDLAARTRDFLERALKDTQALDQELASQQQGG